MGSDRGDNSENYRYCRKCGEEIIPDRSFCPKCGQNQKGESAFGTGISIYDVPFSRNEVIAVIGSLGVFLGAFLRWGSNPLASVTGLSIGWGYLTLLLSFIMGIISYGSSRDRKRMLGLFIGGGIIFVIGIIVFSRIGGSSSIRPGGGLILTLLGGIAIAFSGIRGYAILTSEGQAAWVFTGIIVGLIVMVAVGTAGAQIATSWAEKQEAKQDLTDLEVKQVETYVEYQEEDLQKNYPSIKRIVVGIQAKNPTEEGLWAKAVATLNINGSSYKDTRSMPIDAYNSGYYKGKFREEDIGVPIEDIEPRGKKNAVVCEQKSDYRYKCDLSDYSVIVQLKPQV